MPRHKLPDYLPTGFSSYFDIYKKIVKEQKIDISDNGMNITFEHFIHELNPDFAETFYHELKVGEIKARAFDEIISKLPSKIALHNSLNAIRGEMYLDGFLKSQVIDEPPVIQQLYNLLEICR